MKAKQKIKRYLLFMAILWIVPISAQETKTVQGKVIEQDTGQPIPGVSIVLKNTTKGTVTDFDGNFSIEASSSDILVASYIGFKTQEIPINTQVTINIGMAVDTQQLDEVILVGYGTQSTRTVTGAVQQINTQELTDLPVAQITQKLQGRLVGVQINQATGRPGQGVQVRIRGQASILAGSEPLYVVDGFPIVGNISQINPDEIESISVLKDAASTSLYGSRAANGVVLVTTNRGKAGQDNISLNTYFGLQSVPDRGRPDLMNGTEFAQFKKESFEDLGLPVPEIFQNPAQFGKGYDWFDAMLRTAAIQSHNVTWVTGNEKSTTALTAGFFNQEGVMLNSDFRRYSLRVNSDFKINDKIKAGFSVAPTYIEDNLPSSDGAFFTTNINPALAGGLIANAALAWPVIPYKNEDGTLPLTAFIDGLSAFPNPNWVRSIQEITNETKSIRILANTFLDYSPIENLVLRTTFNIDFGRSSLVNFQPSTASTTFASLPPLTATSLRQNNNFLSWMSENTAVYKRAFGDHNVEGLIGYSVQKFETDNNQIFLSDFPDDRVNSIQSAVNIDRTRSFENAGESALLSYFSRVNYNYKSKYLLSASLRRDGSSRFGSQNRWGNFASVSAGWVFSDEEFLAAIPALSFGKLRASYGTIGNNNIGDFTQFPLVNNSITGVFGNTIVSGAAVTALGNANLGWEKTSQFDLGLDLGLFNNRINFTYDYYTKTTDDLLFDVEVPQESGFTNFNDNVGEIKFWGHEFSISTKNFVGEFQWTSQFNIAFNKNEVQELAEGVDRIFGGFGDYQTITREGSPIGLFWGLIQDGVFVDQADFDNSPKAVESQVGTIKFRDANEDGIITFGGDQDDRVVIGDPNPDYTFGITNEFKFKNFDLGIVMSGSVGNDIAVISEQGTTNLDGVFNVLKDVKNRWRSPENPGNGKFGKTTAATFMERDWFNTRFIQDGSHLAIKNITLGYSLPLKENSFLSRARIYGSVQQVYTFTSFKGANPEVSVSQTGTSTNALSSGFDFSTFPVPRTFTIGLNLGF